jgi:hypothetical protein
MSATGAGGGYRRGRGNATTSSSLTTDGETEAERGERVLTVKLDLSSGALSVAVAEFPGPWKGNK